jgi:hypothetical protein
MWDSWWEDLACDCELDNRELTEIVIQKKRERTDKTVVVVEYLQVNYANIYQANIY